MTAEAVAALYCALIDGCCPRRPTFLSGLESEHMSRHKMEECGTLHYKELQDFLHCIQQDALWGNTHTHPESRKHTTPTDLHPHLQRLKIYLPAAASRRERRALLVL